MGKYILKIIFIFNIYRNKEKTKISDDAPEWFDVFPSWKVKQYNDYIAKNQTILNVKTTKLDHCKFKDKR